MDMVDKLYYDKAAEVKKFSPMKSMDNNPAHRINDPTIEEEQLVYEHNNEVINRVYRGRDESRNTLKRSVRNIIRPYYIYPTATRDGEEYKSVDERVLEARGVSKNDGHRSIRTLKAKKNRYGFWVAR